MRIAASLLVLVGCGGSAPAPVSAPPAPAPRVRDLAVPEPYKPPPEKPPEPRDPRWPWIAEGRRGPPLKVLLVEGELIRLGRGMQLERADADFAESELWEPCVREFVRAQPAATRRALTAALARYRTSCGSDGRVLLQGVRGLDGRDRRGRSGVELTGALSASRLEISLRVAYCDGPLAADRIAIAAGGERWSSPRLSFAKDAQGCEVAELPWTRSLAGAVRAAVGSSDAVVAFEGAEPRELVLADETKQHLGAMLEALDALEDR